MDLAGHGAIETTLTFYTHSTNEILSTAISDLEEYRNKKAKNTANKPVSMIGHNSKRLK